MVSPYTRMLALLTLALAAFAPVAFADPRRMLPAFAAERDANYVGGGGPHTREAQAAAEIDIAARVSAATAAAGDRRLGSYKTYKYWTYGKMVAAMKKLERDHPDLVELFSAQDRWGLPNPGSCEKEGGGGSAPCEVWVLRLTNEKTLPEPARPEVFFSGALHGNERVGPNAVMELALLFAQHYVQGSNPWVTRLLNTRSLLMTPMTNAYGYHHNRREEQGIDPNRDFPYEQKPSECMATVAARAVNELWREHLVQLAITFHAGMSCISYEWGSFNHYAKPADRISPDDTAQVALGAAMSTYAGRFKQAGMHAARPYPHKRINDVVYPVHGGMEDWAYAASWENAVTRPKPIGTCTGTSGPHGRYPTAKTQYAPSMIRIFNFLVETSDRKHPDERMLGDSRGAMAPARRDSAEDFSRLNA